MAAGLGFKTFTTGEVLTAADTNGYLMQGVLVFASAAARDAAITSPQEGQFAYLKDTNVTTYYTGSAWANLDTTGMTNPMTTTGDMVYSSSGSTPARLGIGSTGQVITVAGGIPSWATPSSGGMTLLSTTTLSGASTTISGISQDYVTLVAFIYGMTNATADGVFRIAPNGVTNGCRLAICQETGGAATTSAQINTYITNGQTMLRTNDTNSAVLTISNYKADYAAYDSRPVNYTGYIRLASPADHTFNAGGRFEDSATVSSLVFTNSGGNFSTGTVQLYGVK